MNRLCGLWLCAWSLMAATAPLHAATKVAVVSDRDPALAAIVDLAVAKLTAESNLELLERDEIQRVLAEQKLTKSGLVDAADVIALGKILKADLFAVVESPTTKDDSPSIVVFDAITGVRYWDAVLSDREREVDRFADSVAVAVQTAVGKRSRVGQGLQTVGFVTIRNADLPRQQDALCETLGFLIERNLPKSPDLAVLERRRLARVNEERSLPGATDNASLLSSLTLIDLEVSRGEGGAGLRAAAIIRTQGKEGVETATATVGHSNVALLADLLTQKVAEKLQAAPVKGKPDHRSEAKRFDIEAAHHLSHQRFADAVRAEEAAYALDSENADYRERLSSTLIRYAVYLFSPTEFTMTKGGNNAWANTKIESHTLEILLIAAQRSIELNGQLKRTSVNTPLYNQRLGLLCDRLRGYRRTASEAIRSQSDEWLDVCRRRSLDYCEEWAKKAEADPKWHDGYTSAVHLECGLIKSASVDTIQYANCMSQLAGRWVAVTKSIPPDVVKSDGGELLNMLLNSFVSPTNWPWDCDPVEYARGMSSVYNSMMQHERPIVQLYGQFGRLRAAALLQTQSEADVYAKFATDYRSQAQSIIASPAPWDAERTRYSAYEAWRNAIEQMPGKGQHDFAKVEFAALCKFMIGREELNYKILQSALWKLDPKASLELVDQALPVVASSKLKESDSERSRLKSLLQTTQQKILSEHPELLKSPVILPWRKATKIFDANLPTGYVHLAGCTQIGDELFGVCIEFREGRGGLRLVRISQTGDKPELLGWADLGLREADLPAHLRYSFIRSICVHERAIYVATFGAGVVVFPEKNSEPRRIDSQSGLPSNKSTSLGVLGSKLYVGFDDGYLVAYDLATNQCDVIASSRRKQKLSPFDDGDVFKVPMLVADAARNRIVFVIGKHVWKLTGDGKISSIVDLAAISKGRSEPKLTGPNIVWSSPLRGNSVYLSNAFHVVEINLEQDRGIEIHAPEFGIFHAHPPHLVFDGWLWAASTFSRMTLEKREFQALPHPGGGASPFRANTYLDVTGDKRHIIVADHASVWRLDLKAADE